MDHGSEVEPSKAPPSASASSLPPSSSSSSSSSHDFSRTEPETTLAAFSFDKALNDINDANGNYSIPGEVFFASTSSASKVSDESASQNWSPMQSPPVQVMENSGEFDDSGRISISILTSDTSTPGSSFSFEPWSNCKKLDTSMSSASKAAERSPNGPPSSIFRSKSSTPTDWSHASNESLFSIQIGNHSFSGDLIFRSGEFETFGEHGRYGHMPVAHIGEDNKDALHTGVHVVPLGAGANGHSPSNFVSHPITKKPESTRCEYCCTGAAAPVSVYTAAVKSPSVQAASAADGASPVATAVNKDGPAQIATAANDQSLVGVAATNSPALLATAVSQLHVHAFPSSVQSGEAVFAMALALSIVDNVANDRCLKQASIFTKNTKYIFVYSYVY
ncbi:unnamed protein product [Cuscuta campestris]|uniref:Uncharacterized protein n=1 Tax=Cuscuta campestris TaxID=132261 RepID=A0A484MUY9_9ASTE|nr:unnamed protein product [Cuscuta campestris]